MKYSLSTPIVDLDGKQTEEPNNVKGTMYLGLTRALMADHDDAGNPIKGDEKIKRYDLLMKIRKQDEVDLDVEEVALLSRAVLIFPTLVAGQIRAFLNQRG